MKKTKKGMALVYVMIMGTLMLVLAVCLLTIVNISAVHNRYSLEYAQGYSNARSAISYAQGVLLNKCDDDDVQAFYVTATSASDSHLTFTYTDGTPAVNDGSIYAVCSYIPSTGAVAITGYIKTPTYSQSKTLTYSTTLTLKTLTDISDSFNSTAISEDQSEITQNVTISSSAVSLNTGLLVVDADSTVSIIVPYKGNVTMSAASGSIVPVLLRTDTDIITQNKNGNPSSTINLAAGHYHFTSGGKLNNASSWASQDDSGSEHYQKYMFTGGVFD